jgi:hypothetical protein
MFNGVFTSLFYKAEIVITAEVARHVSEIRVLMKKFREGRVKTSTNWDVVRSSPPPEEPGEATEPTEPPEAVPAALPE